MMNWFSLVSYYLWVAPHVLLIPVAIILLKRRLYTKFPIFTVYVCHELAEFVVLFAISHLGHNQGVLYVRAFLSTLAISTALRFGVIQEIFNNVFREEKQSEAVARLSLRWATVALVTIAVLCSIFASGQTSGTLIAGAAWVERAVAMVQCGLVLFLFLFSGLLGVSLQSYAFGMALGFGILSSVELANWAMHTHELSVSAAQVLNLLPTGGYHIAVVVWLAYLLVPARTIVQTIELPVTQVEEWNLELKRFLL